MHPSGFGNESIDGEPELELYDLSNDPRQEVNIAAQHPELFKRLKGSYDDWFADVSSTRPDNYAPPRIVVGSQHELRSVLTRQDWRHSAGGTWAPTSNGFWLVEATEPKNYELELIFAADHPAGLATVRVGRTTATLDIVAHQRRGHRLALQLPAGKMKLSVDVDFEGKIQGPHQVILTVK